MKKSESQVDADKKGKARMKKFNDRQTSTEESSSNTRSITYWEKIEPGPWEEKEYVYEK